MKSKSELKLKIEMAVFTILWLAVATTLYYLLK
jgi:hypothetical protein